MNETPKNIIEIKIKQIVPCRWRTGIRNQEIFEQLKNDIEKNGLNNPIVVRPIGNGKYEPIIGDHRLEIFKDLKRETIPCIVEEMDDKKALERCLADNICRANYSSTDLENWVYKLKQTSHYKSNEEIGNVIGLTKQRIGQLLTAKEDRDKFNEMLQNEGRKETLQVSTQAILDSRIFLEDNDRLALLKMVQKKKITSNNIVKVAKTLATMDEKSRFKILYHGVDFYEVMAEHNFAITKALKQKETHKIRSVTNNRYTEVLYEQICDGLQPYMETLEYSNNGEIPINYLKMSMAVMAQELFKHKKITKEQFKKIKEFLGIYREELYNYAGDPFQKIGGGVESFV